MTFQKGNKSSGWKSMSFGKTDAQKRGRNNRRRGASGELEVAKILTEALGIVCKRELSQVRDSGCDVRIPGFNIECKRRKKISGLYDWIAQAIDGKGTPVVALRADGERWLAVMDLQDWIKLAREEIAK